MPLYDLECINCGNSDDFIIGLSEITSMKDTNNMNLSTLGISCKNCGKSSFKKLISINAKMAENWAAWNKKIK